MAESDWYGPFSRGRGLGYLLCVAGAVIAICGIAGVGFRRYSATVEGPYFIGRADWPVVAGGVVVFLVGAVRIRGGRL